MTTEMYIKLYQVRDRLKELGNTVADLYQFSKVAKEIEHLK
jgi:hypothetical protein